MSKGRQTLRIDIDKALFDPASVFTFPEEVLDHPGLDTKQKIEILRRWAYDASEISAAVDEGMRDGDNDMLRRILIALGRLSESSEGPKNQQDTR